MATVRVSKPAVVTINGIPTALVMNEPYDDDDPIVREFPWAFESDIEQATAAPGEKRTTRRKA